MKKKLTIEGERVQEVGYRLFLFDVAESCGLKGFFARNIGENVEFFIEGEETGAKKFLSEARETYPEYAKVKSVKVEDYEGDVMPVESFYRSFSLQQLTKIVDVGIGILKKQDIMVERQDSMLEKQDIMIVKQDVMIEKQDKMLEKQDIMIAKQDVMIGKQDKMLEKQDQMLEKQDVMIAKQDVMIEKQDEMLKKQDTLIEEVKNLRGDLKNFMEERFAKIDRDIALIKEKIGLK